MSADEPFLSFATDQSPAGREAYAELMSKMREDSGVFAIPTASPFAATYISLAIVILVVVFLYMLHEGAAAKEEVVVYGSAGAIGLLIASGVSI